MAVSTGATHGQAHVFRNVADLLLDLHGVGARIGAQRGHRARVGLEHAHDEAQRRGLAGAVGTDQGEARAGFHFAGVDEGKLRILAYVGGKQVAVGEVTAPAKDVVLKLPEDQALSEKPSCCGHRSARCAVLQLGFGSSTVRSPTPLRSRCPRDGVIPDRA